MNSFCVECGLGYASDQNPDLMCEDCYATLSNTWKKLDRAETLGYHSDEGL